MCVVYPMHDTPATPPGTRRRAWTPSPCAAPAWSPCTILRSPRSERVPRPIAVSGLQQEYPSIFFGTPTSVERRLHFDYETDTPTKNVGRDQVHYYDSPSGSSELSSLGSPGVGRAAPAPSSTSIVDDILDIPDAVPRASPVRTPFSVNTILHDWASSRFERPFSPSKSQAPQTPAAPAAHDENVFTDAGKYTHDHRGAALRSLAGRFRTGVHGGAMRVPGYVPSDARPAARATPEHRPGSSPFRPSPRKLQRPVRYANSVPAKRVWDNGDAETQKRKRDDQQEELDTADEARERLRRRTSLRVAERQQRDSQTASASTTPVLSAQATPMTQASAPAPGRTEPRGLAARTDAPLALRPQRQLPLTPSSRIRAPATIKPPLSDHEIASLTARNTKKNQGYSIRIETRVERMRGARPPSPEPHFCGGHGVVSRKGRQGSATHHARGAGDEYEYKSPPRLVHCVRWDKSLVTSPTRHEPKNLRTRQPCLRQRVSRGHTAARNGGVVVIHRRVYDDDPKV